MLRSPSRKKDKEKTGKLEKLRGRQIGIHHSLANIRGKITKEK